jgi:putative Holliday junction resolvase
MRVMAIDYGSKATGIAITDELQLTVRALTTLRNVRDTKLIESISSLVNENDVGRLVVGLPLNMDGTRGEAAGRVERFVSELQNHLMIPIVTVDERLTSYEADQIMREEGLSEMERRLRSDEYAAAIILRDYLDSRGPREIDKDPEEPPQCPQ